MKKRTLLITLVFCTAVAEASENLVFNGDFSDGVSGWYGTDLSVQKLSGNKCLKVWLRQWDSSSLSQELQISGPYHSYSVQCRYKTSRNYIGKGVKISAVPISRESKKPDNIQSARESFDLQRTDEWTPLVYNINFESGLTNCEHILLEFETQPGQGVLYLDDIEMTGSLSRLEVIEPEPVPEKTKPEEGKSDDDKNPEFESLPKNNTGNLLKNGDFGDEDEYWKAAPDKKWSLRSGYAVMEIKNYDKERKNIGALRQYNMINNQNCTTFYVRGKYKTSADYTGEEFRPAVYCESNTGIAKWKRVPIEAATEWTEFHCTVHFKKDLPDNTLSFQLYVRQGTGEIYFDDLELYGIPD